MFLDSQNGRWIMINNHRGKKPAERYGHTTTYHKGSLVIFGGE
jgi:hypothetical protein